MTSRPSASFAHGLARRLSGPRRAQRQGGAGAAARRSPISSSSTSACPTSRASSCCGRSASRTKACRSSCCRAAPTRPARCRRSTSAPTTTSPSRSAWTSCSPACAPRCATSAGPGRAADFPGGRSLGRPRPPDRQVREQDVKLSPKEYDLLRLLAQHAGKVLTHNYLLDQLWGPSDRREYLRVYVRQLRKKIEPTRNVPNTFSLKPGSATACARRTEARAGRIPKGSSNTDAAQRHSHPRPRASRRACRRQVGAPPRAVAHPPALKKKSPKRRSRRRW